MMNTKLFDEEIVEYSNEVKTEIGTRIQECRLMKNMTGADFGAYIGVNSNQVSPIHILNPGTVPANQPVPIQILRQGTVPVNQPANTNNQRIHFRTTVDGLKNIIANKQGTNPSEILNNFDISIT